MRTMSLFLVFLGMAAERLLEWYFFITRKPVRQNDEKTEPQGDEHIDGPDCWCDPDLFFEWDGREVWIHKGPGDELPPPNVVASAIADAISGYEGDRYFPQEA